MGQLEVILQKKPAIWNEIRKNTKSDTSAEKSWQSSEDGTMETRLRLMAKSIEKMMTALKSLLRLAENESHNLT